MLSLTQYWNAVWVIDTCSVQPCPQLWNRSICIVRSAAEMLRSLKCLRWICQEENRAFTLTGLKSGTQLATKAHGKRLFVFQTITWAGEMTQRVKVLAVKTERQSWIPGTHMAEGEWLLQVVLTSTWALVCIPLLLQKCNNTKKQQTEVALWSWGRKLMDKASLSYSIVYYI